MARNYEYTLKQGDTGPAVRVHILNDSDQTEPDFTGAVVTFRMLQIDPETGELIVIFDSPAAPENPPSSSGILRYDWATGDTDTLGRFMSLFEVIFLDGSIEHYPNEGYIWVTIEPATGT